MNEWTEQEEQEIIDRAKTGDPEANYALSLWALQRSEEEPDEPRWNRLAAKCLVKAAQAGYGPAKEQMDALLHPDDPRPAPKAAPSRRAAPPEPVSIHDARQAARRVPAHQTTARHVAPAPPEPEEPDEEEEPDIGRLGISEDDWGEEEEEEAPPVPRRSRRSASQSGKGRGKSKNRDKEEDEDEDERTGRSRQRDRGTAPQWGDAQWRKMEIICVAVCAALLVAIAVMLFTSRRSSSDSANPNSAIPPAGEVAPAANSAAPAEVPAQDYPDEATKSAIMAADLDIQPSVEDYVTEPTSGTVSVSSVALRLRKGPNTSYDLVAEMPNGSNISVFAKKNDWFLVRFDGDEGTVYGWCSSEYVILSASSGPAA